jgi:mannosyltransferase
MVSNARRVPIAIVALIAAATAILAFWGLDRNSIWFDEAYSVDAARSGLRGIARLAGDGEINMALYYVALRAWLAIGDGDWWLRALSAGSVVVTVPLVWHLGRTAAGEQAGIVAALAFGLNALVIDRAQEARSYGPSMALMTGAVVLLVRAADEPSLRRWVMATVAVAAVPFAHVLAGLAVAGWYAALLLTGGPSTRRAAIVSALVIGVAASPIVVVIALTGGTDQTFVAPPSVSQVVDGLAGLAGAGWFLGSEQPAAIVLVLGTVVLASVGAIATVRAAIGRGRASSSAALVLGWALAGVGGLLVLSVVKPVFIPRYLSLALPPLAVIIGAGVVALRWHPGARVAVVGLVVLLAAGSIRGHVESTTPDWRAATASILRDAARGDVVVILESWNWRPYRYYVMASENEALAPRRLWRGLNSASDTYASSLATTAATEAAAGRRIWVIVAASSRGRVDPDVDARLDGLRETYRQVHLERFTGIVVARFEPR